MSKTRWKANIGESYSKQRDQHMQKFTEAIKHALFVYVAKQLEKYSGQMQDFSGTLGWDGCIFIQQVEGTRVERRGWIQKTSKRYHE